jgi:MFS family permease
MAAELEEPKEELKEAAKADRLPSLWHNRDFMLLWSGQIVSGLGSNMTALALPLLILALTNSPQSAGIVSACFSIPFVLFNLPAGALMDRWDRKRVMIICDIVRALNIVTIPIAGFAGVLTVGQMLVNALIEGSAVVFFSTAETAALPQVVDKRQLPAAAAQNGAAFGLMDMIGAPVAGFIYNVIGKFVPFIFDAISYSASVFSLMLIRTEFQTERAKTERHLGAEIKEGLSWLWSRPLIRALTFLAAGVNLRLAANALIIIVLAQGMHADAFTIGLIFSFGAGAGIIGSILGGIIQKRFGFARVILVTTWLPLLLATLLAFVGNLAALTLVVVALYLVDPIYDVTQFTYRLALIPDRLQGRVNSSFRLIAWGMRPIGAILAGWLLQQFGGTVAELTIVGLAACFALFSLSAPMRTAAPLERAEAS